MANERCGWSHMTCVASFWFASPITHQVDELVKPEQALWCEKETKWLKKATMYHFFAFGPNPNEANYYRSESTLKVCITCLKDLCSC